MQSRPHSRQGQRRRLEPHFSMCLIDVANPVRMEQRFDPAGFRRSDGSGDYVASRCPLIVTDRMALMCSGRRSAATRR